MPFEDARSHFVDILDSLKAIADFVAGMDLNSFQQDAKTRAAVERKLLVISEAAIRLKERGEQLCPGVPWRDVRGIGNWLRHQYDRVDVETLWNTVQDDLPQLRSAVEQTLAQMP